MLTELPIRSTIKYRDLFKEIIVVKKNGHDYPDPLMIFDTECELLNHISARSFSLKKI